MQHPDTEDGTSGFAARLLFGLVSRVRRRLGGAEGAVLQITALTRKTAIIEIFRNHWADEVGTRLSLVELIAAWKEVGLRADDLAAGLNEMLEDGSLQLHPNHYKPAVTLTQSGKDWLNGVGVDPRLLAEENRTLALLRERNKKQMPEEIEPGEMPHWRIVDRRIRVEVEQE